jgi:hypothetical protein
MELGILKPPHKTKWKSVKISTKPPRTEIFCDLFDAKEPLRESKRLSLDQFFDFATERKQ